MARLYGTYVVVACDRDMDKNEKIDRVRIGVVQLIDNLKRLETTMDEDSLEIIVHEGWHFGTEALYNDDVEPFWAVTIGAKYRGDLQEET